MLVFVFVFVFVFVMAIMLLRKGDHSLDLGSVTVTMSYILISVCLFIICAMDTISASINVSRTTQRPEHSFIDH
jgi:hypothetical protein